MPSVLSMFPGVSLLYFLSCSGDYSSFWHSGDNLVQLFVLLSILTSTVPFCTEHHLPHIPAAYLWYTDLQAFTQDWCLWCVLCNNLWVFKQHVYIVVLLIDCTIWIPHSILALVVSGSILHGGTWLQEVENSSSHVFSFFHSILSPYTTSHHGCVCI